MMNTNVLYTHAFRLF